MLFHGCSSKLKITVCDFRVFCAWRLLEMTDRADRQSFQIELAGGDSTSELFHTLMGNS